MIWLYIAAAIIVLILAYILFWAICMAASTADDANENAAIRRIAEDATDAKIGKAVRGETKWKARLAPDSDDDLGLFEESIK